jgi:hypothetical protein
MLTSAVAPRAMVREESLEHSDCGCGCLWCGQWRWLPRQSAFRSGLCAGPRSDNALILFRFLAALYIMGERIGNFSRKPALKFFAYLTNWGALITMSHFLISALILLWDLYPAARCCDQRTTEEAAREVELHKMGLEAVVPGAEAGGTPAIARSETGRSSCCCRPTNDLRRYAITVYEVILPIETIIVIVYWTLLFNPAEFVELYSQFSDISAHAVPLALLIIETVWGRLPFMLAHIWLVLVGVAYVIVNAVFTVVDGKVVYKVLQWNLNPGGATTFAVGIFVAAIAAYIMWWALVKYVRDACILKESSLVEDSSLPPVETVGASV